MIFFKEKIESFLSSDAGMKVKPEPCTLIDGRKGFYLGSNVWNEDLERLGAKIEPIKESDLKIVTEN